MRFASWGSGSAGNAWVVEADSTRVLIDCGFGPRELVRRLHRLGIEPDSIAAIAVTHEHSDHVGGAPACARRFGWPVFLTRGTAASLNGQTTGFAATMIESQTLLSVGSLEIRPYTVPHDAREPVQFVVSDGQRKLGLLTDAGHATPHMIDALGGCDALVLECNHDANLLRAGRYPHFLKQRISSPWGHLENSAAAGLLAALDRSRLRQVVAAHLSEQNNRPDLAQAALATVLGCSPDWIAVADQETGLDWRDV